MSETVATSPAAPVAPGSDDFVSNNRDEVVLSNDLAELTRQAHASGWLRDAFFGFDTATLDSDARAALETSARWLRANPQYSLRIEGHCDERGTEQYNFGLGERRASTVRDYLVTLGVDPARLATLSYGESEPFAAGSDEESMAQNRRAHLVIVSRTR